MFSILMFVAGFLIAKAIYSRKGTETAEIMTEAGEIQTEPTQTERDTPKASTDKELARRQRAEKKAAEDMQKREQAALALDHYTVQRERLMELADAIEAELSSNLITDKRRAALLRQRITIEERLFQTDKKINKAFFVVNKAA